MTASGQAWTPDLGDKFCDWRQIEDSRKCDHFLDIFIRRGDNRMYWMIPCDITTSRARIYKRRQPKGENDFGVSSAVRAGKPVK
ncbi:hypothetical protein AVEN_270692-1 [Araneus ventricosus]|uniref:Uncharacterized protein n=1 Tax=Araneus ventricosus TaxID=182803 RepID=A0A4Y2FW52_ARAVE|nr:hypothetical protein AVEN_270692-1 [Araneus ventricosus]